MNAEQLSERMQYPLPGLLAGKNLRWPPRSATDKRWKHEERQWKLRTRVLSRFLNRFLNRRGERASADWAKNELNRRETAVCARSAFLDAVRRRAESLGEHERVM